MSASSIEKHELEQDIDGLRGSLEALESSRDRIREIAPSDGSAGSKGLLADLAAVVTDFFQVAGSAFEGEDDEDDDDGSAVDKVKKVVTTDWSKPLGDAFSKLKDRLAEDLHLKSPPAPLSELTGVMSQLDSEIARLNAELQSKLDRVAVLDDDLDDTGPTPRPDTPVHHDVVDTTTTTTVDTDDDVVPTPIIIDVDPMPLVVDVDPTPVVDVDPTPVVDVDPTPVVDVTTDVVIPTPEPDVHVTPIEDDTPAYEPGTSTEIGELDGAIYDVNEILAAGRTVADLRRYDVPAGVVRDAGITASAMLNGGYSVAELHEAGYQAADLHGIAGASDLRGAGYSAGDLHGVFTVAECVEAFSVHELQEAGFTLSDFHGVVPLSSLRDVLSVAELRSAYSAADLHSAGFDAAELVAGGFGWDELAAAGFNSSELQHAGATSDELQHLFPGEFSAVDDSSTQPHSN